MPRLNEKHQWYQHTILLLIIVVGFTVRFILANGRFNQDLQSFVVNAELFRQGVPNFYLVQPVYGYPPLWYYICGLLGVFQRTFGISSFALVERMFLSLVDLGIMFILMALAKRRGTNPLIVAALFFLSPISIIISAYHGQFDNVTLFFVVTAILALEQNHWKRFSREIVAFISLTLALLLKQAIIFHVFTVFLAFSKKRITGILLTGCSVILFFLSFLPFIEGALGPMKDTMNRYGGILGTYGISYIAFMYCGQCSISILGMNFWVFLRNIFMVLMIVYIYFNRHKDIARSSLLMTLFFYTFTSGIAPQYFVYPLVFGALFPSKWFLLYSVVTSIFLMGHWDELNITALQTINYNTVWITVVLWYISELIRTNTTAHALYTKARELGSSTHTTS